MRKIKETKRKRFLLLIVLGIFIFNLNFVFCQSYYDAYATINPGYDSSSSYYNGYYTRDYNNGIYSSNYNTNAVPNSAPNSNINPNPTYNYNNPGDYSGANYGSNSYNGYNVYGSSVNPQFTSPSYTSYSGYTNPNVFWPSYNTDNCMETRDIAVQVIPGSCTPSIVRSDLLEEQNVPIFCKIMSIQTNPLVDISQIKSIHFKGNYPRGISGISYYPARAALLNRNDYFTNSFAKFPVNTNAGYMVVVLSRQSSERDMPDFIEANITATLDYSSESAFGIGKNSFYLSELTDEDWAREYQTYGFWNGKGYLRADAIESDHAVISVYSNVDDQYASFTLKPGETSKEIYLKGFYCSAGMNLKLEKIGAPVESALLQINDQQMWVSKGDKIISDKCRILSLESYGGGGKISISCPSKNGNIELSLNPGKANINVQGSAKEIAVGDKIYPDKNIYLAYLGQDINNKKYSVIVRDDFSVTKYEFADKQIYETLETGAGSSGKTLEDIKETIKKVVLDQYRKKIRTELQQFIGKNIEVSVVEEGQEGLGVQMNEVLIAKDKEWITDDSSSGDILAKEYFDKAIDNYNELFDLYPSEKRIPGEDSYAAVGLYEAARLSRLFGMNAKAQEFYDKLIKEYPGSNIARRVRSERDLIMRYDNSKAGVNVVVGGEAYSISLVDFKKPGIKELSAVLLVNGKEQTFGLKDLKILKNDKEIITLQIRKIEPDLVEIRYEKSGGEKAGFVRTERITKENNQVMIEGTNIKLLRINFEKQVKVTVIPKTYGQRVDSGFSFRVSIDKRAIRLTPEQTKAMIEALKLQIQIWEDLNSKLGMLIRAMKGACFATSSILTVKNMLYGAGGEAIARNNLMTSVGGWNQYCEKLVNEGKYSSLQQCLFDKNSEIENDVKTYANGIKKMNEIISGIQKQVGVKPGTFGVGGSVDSSKVEQKFKEKFDEFCKNMQGDVGIYDKEKTTVSFQGQNGVCSWQNMTHEQRRDIMTLAELKNSGSSVMSDVVNKKLGESVLEARNYQENLKGIAQTEQNSKEHNLNIRTLIPGGESIIVGDVKRILGTDSKHEIYKNFKDGSRVVRIFIPAKKSFGRTEFNAHADVAGKEVIVEVKEDSAARGIYSVVSDGKIVGIDGKELTGEALNSVREYLSLAGINKIREADFKAYKNPIRNPEELFVKYFERAPFKGLPAEIVFDTNEGWYVEMSYVLNGFGRPYDESGRAVNFYICNVGANGLLEFKKSADDICRYYNVDIGADLNFPGLSITESRNLISKAQQAIADAAKQYGKSKVTVNGRSFKSGTAFGGEAGKCTDFMSAADCAVIFNVCDPIICPASRCDLGGQFRVDNVIQSGIVGSMVLCLPNYKEGVAIPVCLSGIYAGIDGLLSILKSSVKCLEEGLATGRNVGICDEIKSIYLCEFFWKQSIPVLNALIPNVLESMNSQGVRGGGEYSSVQGAWNNMQNSVNYFTTEYAVNSVNAFNARSAEDAGSGFCRAFTSMNFGNAAGDLFNRITEPESPPQYHAWFSENPMTTATVPPTSHYKVYYHIYAGKNMGGSYAVYLKDSPQITNIYSTGSYVVARGYVARGSQDDEAKDFTAPSGYKQLCISVNGKDECGFGQVTTSYFLDSLTDQYASEQIQTDLKTEKECVAGTPSSTQLFNPNMQASIQLQEPQIYNQGIIRVCASENPGKKVLASGEYDTTSTSSDRWKEVGYCDEPTIKCWLDTNSVKNVINNKQIEQQVLQNVELSRLGEIDFWTDSKSASVANEAEKAITQLTITKGEGRDSIESKIKSSADNLIQLTKLGNSNLHRSRGMYLLANLYRKVAEGLLAGNIENPKAATSTGEGSEEPSLEPIDEEEIKAGESSDSETSWTEDRDLKDETVIKVDYMTKKYVYKYSSADKKWMSDDSEFLQYAEKNKLGYANGIRYLVKKTNFFGKIVIENKVIENNLFDSSEKMAEEVFGVLKRI